MNGEIKVLRCNGKEHVPYVNDDGIYVPTAYSDQVYYQRIITKEMFIEAYNKWIKPEYRITFPTISCNDDADCWCE